MQDTQNEPVRFSMKPNPFFYALEVTRHTLLVGTTAGLISGIPLIWSVIYSDGTFLPSVVLLLITYLLVGLFLFIVAIIFGYHVLFIVTDRRAIVRISFLRMTADALSIAIEAVKQIEINSYNGTYGSVYLNHGKTSSNEKSKDSGLYYPQSKLIRRAGNEATRASVPIQRTNSIWGSIDAWPRLFGFYGFKGFDEFAKIIIERQELRSECGGDA